MTHNPYHMYNKRPPSPENAIIFIGYGTELVVEYVGSVDLVFNSTEDVRVSLESVLFIPSLKVKLLSLHTIQAKEPITLDATGAQIMGGRLFFPKDRAGSRLNATRRPPPLFVFSSLTGYPGFDGRDGTPTPSPPPSPSPPCADACGTTGADAGSICYATVAGGYGSSRGDDGSWFPPFPPYAWYAGNNPPPPPRSSVPVTVQPVRMPGVSAMPLSPGVMVAVEPVIAVNPPTLHTAAVPETSEPALSSANSLEECLLPLPPAFRPAIAAPVLVPGDRRFKAVDINVFQVCIAHAHKGLLRETAKQQGVKLTGTLVTCSGCVQAKRRRASIPTTTSSRKALLYSAFLLTLQAPGGVSKTSTTVSERQG